MTSPDSFRLLTVGVEMVVEIIVVDMYRTNFQLAVYVCLPWDAHFGSGTGCVGGSAPPESPAALKAVVAAAFAWAAFWIASSTDSIEKRDMSASSPTLQGSPHAAAPTILARLVSTWGSEAAEAEEGAATTATGATDSQDKGSGC